MRIENITLENFGVFRHRSFELRSAPLVVLYGANEAGKTTALNGIRQALFGFKPSNNKYLTGQTMQASVDLTLQDGRELTFQRTKGRKDQIDAQLQGVAIDDSRFAEVYSNLNLESYQNLFGFSQEELRAGQAALQDAKLSEALAGGSFGGIHVLECLRNELSESLADLYKSRGKNTPINQKLREIQDCKQELQSFQTSATEIQDLRKQLKQAIKQNDLLRDKATELLALRRRAERLQKALPSFEQFEVVRQELSEIDIPTGLDSTFVTQWGDYAEQRKTLHQRVQKLKDSLQKLKHELKRLGGSSELLESEDLIESLGHQAQSISALREELSRLAKHSQASETKLQNLLDEIELGELPESTEGLQVSLPQKRRLQELARSYRSNRDEVLQLQGQLKAIGEVGSELELDLPESDELNLLKANLQQLQQLETQAQHRFEALEQAMGDPEFLKLAQKLAEQLVAGGQLQMQWQLPKPKRVETLAAEFLELDQLARQLESDLAKLAAEQKQLETAFSHSNSQQHEESEALLRKLSVFSEQRVGVINQWMDELSQPLIAASISPEQQIERLQELERIGQAADQARDEMIEVAEALAQVRQNQKRLEEIRQRESELEIQRVDLVERRQNLHENWAAVLESLPLQEIAPDAFQDWMTDFESWRREQERQQGLRKELHRLRGQVRQLRERLIDDWPVALLGNEAAEQLFGQLQEWSESLRSHQQESKRRADSARQKRKLESRLKDLEAEQSKLTLEFSSWLKTTPVTFDCPPSDCEQLLAVLEGIHAESQKLLGMREEIDSGNAKLERFENEVAALRRQLEERGVSKAADSHGREPEVWMLSQLRALREIREERSKRIQLASDIEHQTQMLGESEKQRETLDEKLAALCVTAGSGSPAETQSLLERIHRAEQLRDRLGKHKAALMAHCGKADFEEFCSQLAENHPAQVEMELKENRQQLSLVDEQREEQQTTIGQLQERLEVLAQSSRYQSSLHKLQTLRGELAELSEQWVVTKLAQEMLSRSIDLFATENEPNLLRKAHGFLATLTGGRYVTVEHEPGNKEKFFVRNADGEAFQPDRLSTGTREQLYLAIRMAFISEYCQSHEALPVVMDDCFVNFDDQRTEHALRAVAGWDEGVQTIILSCHRRLPEIVGRIAPDTPILMLEQDETIAASEFAMIAS